MIAAAHTTSDVTANILPVNEPDTAIPDLPNTCRLIAHMFTTPTTIRAILLMITPTKAQNPIFFIKMALIVVGVVNMWAMRRQVFRRSGIAASGSFTGKMLAVTSLVVWAAAITAGRLMAYLGNTR